MSARQQVRIYSNFFGGDIQSTMDVHSSLFWLGKVLFGLSLYKAQNCSREMFCMRKNSHRKCSRTGGLLDSQKTAHIYTTLLLLLQRGGTRRTSFPIPFLGTTMLPPILPTCSQYRRHAQDPQCRRISTLHVYRTVRVHRAIFLALFLHHFLQLRPRSINVHCSTTHTSRESIQSVHASEIPWLLLQILHVIFVCLFSPIFFIIYGSRCLSFKERPLPSATLDCSKEILMIEDMDDVRESFNSERCNPVRYIGGRLCVFTFTVQ